MTHAYPLPRVSSGLGIAALLLLGGCPDDPATPISTDSEADTGSSTTAADSTTLPPADASGSTAPDPDASGSSTAPDPDTSTGPGDTCGNGALDGSEVCDGDELDGATCLSEGFDVGTLACRADCLDYDRTGCSSYVCGNDVVDPDETCDGSDLGGVTCEGAGFDSGTSTCSLDCSEIDMGSCGTCGNVIVDGAEVCDSIVLLGQTCESQGFSSGQLGCMPDCLTYDTSSCIVCGNDVIDGVEPCDGTDLGGHTCVGEGFVGGVMGCDDECALDLSGCNSCGNAVVDTGESCDGANLGGQTCASLGLQGGTLSCSASCQLDFSACDIPGMLFGNDGFYSGFSLTPGVLPCDDISATGVATGMSDDDQVTVPMGFSLPVYGSLFTEATITSNGVVYFDTPDFLPLGGVCMPGDTFTLSDEYILGVFWDDLDPSSAGDVFYQTLGAPGSQRFVVQWDVPFFGGSVVDLLRFQAVFHQSGSIEVCYVDTVSAADFGNNGNNAAAGIQRDQTLGFGYSCATPDLVSGLMLMYLPL
jgi:hypothetical protein